MSFRPYILLYYCRMCNEPESSIEQSIFTNHLIWIPDQVRNDIVGSIGLLPPSCHSGLTIFVLCRMYNEPESNIKKYIFIIHGIWIPDQVRNDIVGFIGLLPPSCHSGLTIFVLCRMYNEPESNIKKYIFIIHGIWIPDQVRNDIVGFIRFSSPSYHSGLTIFVLCRM